MGRIYVSKVAIASLLVGLGLFNIVLPAYAESVHAPPPPTPNLPGKPDRRKDLDIGLQMGEFRLHFERTTLAHVQRLLGSGRIDTQGEAGEAILWLCYTVQGEKGDERLWIISGSEMGGSDHSVTSIVGESNVRDTPGELCPMLPTAMSPIAIGNGIWIGSSLQTVLKAFGSPTRKDGAWYVYLYEGKVPGRCQPSGFDRDKWLAMRVIEGRIVEIHAGQTTTC
jgi:hypothetical protein